MIAEKDLTSFSAIFFYFAAEKRMKTMTMQDRQTLARRYAAGENVTRIAVDLGMSAAAVYAELRRGYTGGLDGNKRREYDPELGLTRYQESLANRGRRKAATK